MVNIDCDHICHYQQYGGLTDDFKVICTLKNYGECTYPFCNEARNGIHRNDDVTDDQNAKSDYGKAKLTLVPRRIIWNIAAIREYGTKKYGDPENWKNVSPERYRDAALRHFLAYLDDPEGVDKESGFPHLWHLACNIAFLCEMENSK